MQGKQLLKPSSIGEEGEGMVSVEMMELDFKEEGVMSPGIKFVAMNGLRRVWASVFYLITSWIVSLTCWTCLPPHAVVCGGIVACVRVTEGDCDGYQGDNVDFF